MARAIIVGGSMAGLLAANLLLRQGWDVELFERTAEGLEARGAGIATQRALTTALARAGVAVSDDLGIHIRRRVGYDPDGRIVGEHDYPQTTTSWGLLYSRLLAAFPTQFFHKGATVVDVFQDGERAGIRLGDGRELAGDLVIGADGMRSGVRTALAPAVQPVYAGYVAWRGMIEEGDMPPELSAADFANFNFGFHGNEEMVAYPVAGADGSIEPARRRFNMMWYRPADERTLQAILTGNDDRYYEGGIPPQRIRRSVIDEVKHAARGLPPVFAETIARMDGLFVQPIFDLVSEEVVFGRIALIGDAAFVARPHCGAGVSKAAADVLALTDALSKEPDVTVALKLYAAERVPAGSAAVAWARRLGSYILAGDGTAGESGIGPADVVRYTGIELSETGEVSFTGEGGPISRPSLGGGQSVVIVDSAGDLPELDIVEGAGVVKILLWPENGARNRSMHWHRLEAGAALKALQHPSDSVYYILAGTGDVVDIASGTTQALRAGSVVHIDRADRYTIRSSGEALEFVGGPCPPDPDLYRHMKPN